MPIIFIMSNEWEFAKGAMVEIRSQGSIHLVEIIRDLGDFIICKDIPAEALDPAYEDVYREVGHPSAPYIHLNKHRIQSIREIPNFYDRDTNKRKQRFGAELLGVPAQEDYKGPYNL